MGSSAAAWTLRPFAVDDYYSLLQRHERVEGGHAVVEPFNNSTGEEFNTSSSDSDQSTDQEPPAPPNDQALLSLALREHYLRRAGGSGGGGAYARQSGPRETGHPVQVLHHGSCVQPLLGDYFQSLRASG
ncbi:MAG: hypothetical protein WDW36_008005 [Sanguina aurantia]